MAHLTKRQTNLNRRLARGRLFQESRVRGIQPDLFAETVVTDPDRFSEDMVDEAEFITNRLQSADNRFDELQKILKEQA